MTTPVLKCSHCGADHAGGDGTLSILDAVATMQSNESPTCAHQLAELVLKLLMAAVARCQENKEQGEFAILFTGATNNDGELVGYATDFIMREGGRTSRFPGEVGDDPTQAMINLLCRISDGINLVLAERERTH